MKVKKNTNLVLIVQYNIYSVRPAYHLCFTLQFSIKLRTRCQ